MFTLLGKLPSYVGKHYYTSASNAMWSEVKIYALILWEKTIYCAKHAYLLKTSQMR